MRSETSHRGLVAALAILAACASPAVDESPDAGPPPPPVEQDGPLDTVVDVPASGPYGTRTFTVHAKTHWVNTGLFLRKGATARIDAAGTWTLQGREVDAAGDPSAVTERGCKLGSLVARSGLRYEDAIACIGAGATFTAARDDVVYVAMISSTDLGEAYAERLSLDGALQVTVTSAGATVPTVRASQLAGYDLGAVASGRLELAGKHVLVSVSADEARRDLATAADGVATLDAIYEVERALRGMAPFEGQRVRFYADDTVAKYGYMLAGNPIRCVPELMGGNDAQRILRAGVAGVDVWGFAHELGHLFSFANGAWLYQSVNLESWPNVFTIRALTTLGLVDGQPNLATYCDGKDAYLASGTYETLRTDPFVQLCFLMQFTGRYGWAFWERFFEGMNGQSNGDVGYRANDVDRSVWSYVRDRFSLAAGEDVTPLFREWRVPVR